jgi:hypothetical protein
VTIPPRLLKIADRALAGQILLVVAGTVLAFGGAVWWMKPTLAGLTATMAMTALLRAWMTGRIVILKSPLTLMGLVALALAAVQITPLPGRIAGLISPSSRSAHALGVLPDRARADNPSLVMPEAVADRTPASIDRPATLRWLVGAMASLTVFCVCAHYADRLGRSNLIWGSVVAVFFIGTTFGAAQLLSGTSGFYGFVEPGSGRPLSPSLADQASSPGSTVLRPVLETGDAGSAWALPRPDRRFSFGTMVGGPAGYLALAALGLPLALGLTLQTLAPRGSRERLSARLRASNRAGMAALLVSMTAAGAILTGYLSGPVLAAPFAIAMALVGLPAARSSGLRWASVGLTGLVMASLGGGVAMGESWGRPRGCDPWGDSGGFSAARSSWAESARALRQFPLMGSGMGTYSTVASYFKSGDETWTTARSSLLQWAVESGLVGIALVAMAGLWCLLRLPGAVRRVGSADKTLAYTLLGTAVCFALVSTLHGTVEILGVALAACAVGGTCNRWLAGGTDLFVEGA